MTHTGTNHRVERSVAILNAQLAATPRLSEEPQLADIAQNAGSSAYMLLATSAADIVHMAQASQRCTLGPISLRSASINLDPAHRAARHRAQHLAFTLGLGANVPIRRGKSADKLCNFEGFLAGKPITLSCTSTLLNSTGIGNCLPVALTPMERPSLPGSQLPAHTPRTISGYDSLDLEIDAVLVTGFATDLEELVFGRACVSPPIRDGSGTTVAAISVSGSLDVPGNESELPGVPIEAADSDSSKLVNTRHRKGKLV